MSCEEEIARVEKMIRKMEECVVMTFSSVKEIEQRIDAILDQNKEDIKTYCAAELDWVIDRQRAMGAIATLSRTQHQNDIESQRLRDDLCHTWERLCRTHESLAVGKQRLVWERRISLKSARASLEESRNHIKQLETSLRELYERKYRLIRLSRTQEKLKQQLSRMG